MISSIFLTPAKSKFLSVPISSYQFLSVISFLSVTAQANSYRPFFQSGSLGRGCAWNMRQPEGFVKMILHHLGEEMIIPGGDTVIAPGDHVIIFTFRSSIPQVEKILMVKLEYFE